jgi:hypothetical protein
MQKRSVRVLLAYDSDVFSSVFCGMLPAIVIAATTSQSVPVVISTANRIPVCGGLCSSNPASH